MSSQKALIQITLNNENVFLLSENESDLDLYLKIINIKENEAYIGQASNIELRCQASRIRLCFSDFMQKATDALFQNSTDHSSFLYCLDQKDEVYIFKWKSVDAEETIINLGSVEMRKIHFGNILTDILLSLSEEMQNLKTSIQRLSKELNTSTNQLSTALTKLSAADDVKESVEKELFSKFILVLNEKKKKIKELEMKTRTDPCSSKNGVMKRKSAKLSFSSSESDDVDGELEMHQAGPSNVTKKNSLPFYEETKHITQSKIRNRKAPGNKKSCISDHPVALVPTKSDYNIAEDSGSADSLMEFL